MRRWTRRKEGYVARTPVFWRKTGVSATLGGNVAWDVASLARPKQSKKSNAVQEGFTTKARRHEELQNTINHRVLREHGGSHREKLSGKLIDRRVEPQMAQMSQIRVAKYEFICGHRRQLRLIASSVFAGMALAVQKVIHFVACVAFIGNLLG